MFLSFYGLCFLTLQLWSHDRFAYVTRRRFYDEIFPMCLSHTNQQIKKWEKKKDKDWQKITGHSRLIRNDSIVT